MISHEDLWKRNVIEEADTYSYEEKKEIMDTDNLTASDLIVHKDLWKRNVTEEADTYSCEERKEIIDRNNLKVKEKIEFRPGRNPKEAIE